MSSQVRAQALAPARLDFRISVDHGTAFDTAGKGIANAESMAEAIKVAISLVQGARLK